MVDKKLNYLSRNSSYGIIEKTNPLQNIDYNIVYADGAKLQYGDPAEIFGAITDNEFISFLESSLSESSFTREHYWYTFGYQPADFDNEEIKENEVQIHYAGVDNSITKKDFYKLCLLLCDAKLNGIESKEIDKEKILLFKIKLSEKLNTIT